MAVRKGENSWQIKCLKTTTTRCQSGEIVTDFRFSFTKCTERILYGRWQSNVPAIIWIIYHLMVSRAADRCQWRYGRTEYLCGQGKGKFRSYLTGTRKKKNRLVLSCSSWENWIFRWDRWWREKQPVILLDGVYGAKPDLPENAAWKRDRRSLTEVNRSYGKSDYILTYLLGQGRNARFASGFDVKWDMCRSGAGDTEQEYVKTVGDADGKEYRVAYERCPSANWFLEELDWQ